MILQIGKKTKITLIVIIVLVILFLLSFLLDFSRDEVKWGVTFSPEYAEFELGLDWRKTYVAILDDLGVDNIRISAYWNQIERVKDVYYFDDLDFQVDRAASRNVDVILGVGRKLPRWPECHDPKWLSDLDNEEVKKKQLELVEAVITRYDSYDNVRMWQVENEPFLEVFGMCPKLDRELLQQEIELVRSLSSKPILVTDSGELNFWIRAANTGADVIGSTLYRVVYNENIGYLRYPISPLFYYAKAITIKTIFKTSSVINSELQAEAWHTENKDLSQMTLEESFKSMDLEQFKKNIIFSKKAGFDEVYLWGAEWWYFLKESRDYPDFWEEAKTLW